MKESSIISSTLNSLLRSWAIGMGFVAVVLGTSHFISKTWLPVILLAMTYIMAALMRARHIKGRQVCMRVPWAIRTTLIISAFIMFAIVLMHNPHLFGNTFNAPYFNPRIPYVTGLVVFTTGAFVALYALFMGRSLGACRACRKIYGDYDNESLASSLFDNESAHQLRLYLWISVGIAAAQWAYFFVFFINVNYNSPDLFFFNYMPVAVYVLSIVYLASRYYNIVEAYQATVSAGTPRPFKSELRFIVTNGDSMLLREQQPGLWDTPYKAEMHDDNVPEAVARQRFTALGGSDDSTLRYLYSNRSRSGENVIHYAAFVPDESKEKVLRGGHWLNLYEVDKLLHTGGLSPYLANELVRIYTITMAWKTYDRDGKRLYPIKHYKPIFRLRDFKQWDVDYNDTSWLQVSIENEDTPFFKARKLWRKCLDIFNH